MKPLKPICDERCDCCPYADCINDSSKATQYQKAVGNCFQHGAIYHRAALRGKKKEGETS